MKLLKADLMNPHDPEKLERLIHQTLRGLPDRRAPHTLEGRVMAALAARAALPWWRQSFLQWPLAAQAAFLLVCAAVVKLVLSATGFAISDVESASFAQTFATPLAWLDLARASVVGMADFCGVVFRSIPPLWLYGGLAIVLSLYTALFGLGAVAYRALYVQR